MSLPLEVILHVLSSESLSFFLPSRSAESKVESGSGDGPNLSAYFLLEEAKVDQESLFVQL